MRKLESPDWPFKRLLLALLKVVVFIFPKYNTFIFRSTDNQVHLEVPAHIPHPVVMALQHLEKIQTEVFAVQRPNLDQFVATSRHNPQHLNRKKELPLPEYRPA